MVINFELSESQYALANRQVSGLLAENSKISKNILKFPVKLAVLAALLVLPLFLGALAGIIEGLNRILLAFNISFSEAGFLESFIAMLAITLILIFFYMIFKDQPGNNKYSYATDGSPVYAPAGISINHNKIERASLDLDHSPITVTFKDGEKWRIPPNSIYRYAETDDFFIFLADANKVLCIPKEALKHSSDLQDFRKKVKELLPYAPN